jgi:ribosome-associated protein
MADIRAQHSTYAMETYAIEDEFIELCRLLKVLGWVDTGGMAKQVIADGLVTVNGETELRKRYKTRPTNVVVYNGQTVTVTHQRLSHEHEPAC